ncbi:hypothetical protein [Gluconobacter oxydans]|uniref:hypothetical protein n=1 Tax=Gluconobacter oxydans TaxID=442 RepID=UPI0034645DE2
MTLSELFEEFTKHEALLVHCSTPAKTKGPPPPGSSGRATLYFPEDMTTAKKLFEAGTQRLCCSVVWPAHPDAWGDIGLVLKPHDVASIVDVCPIDAGTPSDSSMGSGLGKPFCEQSVSETFKQPSGTHNEWGIRGAEIIGIFIKPNCDKPRVATLHKLSDLPGYDASMGDQSIVAERGVQLSEIEDNFPGLPLYTFHDGKVIDLRPNYATPYSET